MQFYKNIGIQADFTERIFFQTGMEKLQTNGLAQTAVTPVCWQLGYCLSKFLPSLNPLATG